MKEMYYALQPEVIITKVKKNCPGVYTLGKLYGKKFYVKYVGRSETCLRRRLLEQARKKKLSFFSFRIVSDKTAAARNETVAFFTYSELENRIRPSTKKNMIPGLETCESELKKLFNNAEVA